MRHLLAWAAMMFSMVAAADPAMVADQGTSGKVVLTTERHEGCPRGEHIAYLTRLLDPNGPRDTITYWGCWSAGRDIVRIHYFIGNDMRFRRSDFSYDDIPPIPIPHRRVPQEDEPAGLDV